MYVVPIALIILVAFAFFFSPVLALVLLVVFLIGLGLFKFLGPGTEPESAAPPSQTSPPANAPAARATAGNRDGEKTGMWGETWPEQRSGEEPS
jgi:hypothetical protein